MRLQIIRFAISRWQRVNASRGTSSFRVRSDRRVRLYSGHNALPLRTNSCIADAMEKKDEQTLEVNAHHEHRL